MREPFTFDTKLADDSPVRVEASFDHEDTVYLSAVTFLKPDGTDGAICVLDVISHQARFALLAEAASRIPGEV